MRTDSRLSRMLHVLLHMARQDGPITSEQIGVMLGTNAAVVRRTMAGLRKAGYVCAEKGRHGGWRIGCDLNRVTLLDVHHAVGGPRIFAIGTDRDNPDCVVEQVVNEAIYEAMREAEALLIERLGAVTLAELARQFDEIATRQGYRFPTH
ncbi:Rrf2 family transcriptional regulator [Halomonas salipaludis]|uniref:Transcriptional regulator n=1 Tax=Halomonas salipaludis TaxID=2032625 RepID=A0A2A2EV78_9GAMM|nr:transcriptional regulator [Halomonas salipaludis]